MTELFEGFKPPEEVELWPIQKQILSELTEAVRYNKRVVLMSPTGSGKTQIAIQIIKQALKKEKRVCFTCHRITLVEQTSKSLYSQGISHGIIQGDHPDVFPNRAVQVASIQTLSKRKQDKFDIYFFDEIHVMFKSHKQIMDDNPNAYFIGLSASPMAKELGKYFQALIHPVTMRDLINQKVLKEFEIYGPSTIDLTKVGVVAGDYNKKDLKKAADKPKLVADIVKTWLKLAKDRKTIVFCSGVGHGRHLEKEFKRHGIKAAEVNGYQLKESTEDEKGANDIIKGFRDGEYQVIISTEMLVAGFDVTDIGCVVFATATKSKMKFIQALGRGLRMHPGIETCLILDHGSITKNLGFPDTIEAEFNELDDGKKKNKKNKKKKSLEKLPKVCPSCEFLKPPGVQVCPSCGFKPELIKDVAVTEGELKKLSRKARKEYSIADKQKFLGGLNRHAANKNMKKHRKGFYGWALYRYQDKFGCRPSSTLDWSHQCDISAEVKNFIIHGNIAYAKSVEKEPTAKEINKLNGKTVVMLENCKTCGSKIGMLVLGGKEMTLECIMCQNFIKKLSFKEAVKM